MTRLATLLSFSLASIAVASPLVGFNYTAESHVRNKRAYTIKNNYQGSTFFNGWNWFTAPDPTNGNVNFVDQATAAAQGIGYVDANGRAFMKVDDFSSVPSGGKRNSVRIQSAATFVQDDIVILDAVHVPYGCSVWPAFWTVGPNWPNGGEIDIFEGVNGNTKNQATLHTTAGCMHNAAATQTGITLQADCNVAVNSNAGCGVQDQRTTSYGAGFAAAGGGIFAAQWAFDGIFIWHFPRNSIPADITNGAPNPANWGPPVGAWLASTCPLSHFAPQNLVFDITLCGDWAGAQGEFARTCSGTCADAMSSVSNLHEAYWLINYVKVYHQF